MQVAAGRGERSRGDRGRDRGPGIPEAHRSRVFERFYRATTGAATASASGSRSCARRSRRSAARSSSSPSRAGHDGVASCFPAARMTPGVTRDPRRRGRAGDPDAVAYALRGEGFDVETRRRRRAALAGADARRASTCVILDLMLPQLSGTEVCRRIRERERRPDHHADARATPRSTACSGSRSAPTTTSRSRSRWPSSLGRVRAILRRRELDRAAAGSAVQRVGGLELDPVRHRVVVDGRAASR